MAELPEAIQKVLTFVEAFRSPKVIGSKAFGGPNMPISRLLKAVYGVEDPPSEVAAWLADAQHALKSYLETKEFENPSRKRHVQNDKQNRTVFTLHEYIKQTTGQPNWNPLCDSAGGIGSF